MPGPGAGNGDAELPGAHRVGRRPVGSGHRNSSAFGAGGISEADSVQMMEVNRTQKFEADGRPRFEASGGEKYEADSRGVFEAGAGRRRRRSRDDERRNGRVEIGGS